MLNRLFVVDSVTLTSTGTAVSTYTPWDQTTRKLPTQVVVKATGQGAYVRLSNDASAATNADVLVQGGDHVVLSVQGRRWVSVLSDGASSTVNVGALSTGVSGSAASLDLVFVDAGVLDPRVTFTRASTGTFFNSAGVLTSAAINAPRFDYNPATLAAQGLLIEEQRTNLLLRSSDYSATWFTSSVTATANTTDTLDPSGVNGATRFVMGGSSGALGQGVISTATSHAATIFLKTNSGTTTVDLLLYRVSPFGTIASKTVTLTTSWQRFDVIGTFLDTTAHNFQINFGTNKTVYVWGAQLEAGAFPTSYIPTTTTALTRSADVASVNTLSPWFNSTVGTIYVEASNAQVQASLFSTDDGTASNRIVTYFNVANSPAFRVVSGGVDQCNYSAGTITQNAAFKLAAAYQVNDFAASLNGAAVVTDTSGTIPTGQTTARIGTNVSLANSINGYLRRITYYPTRLSNAQLQAITA